jgi:hypothetical protein
MTAEKACIVDAKSPLSKCHFWVFLNTICDMTLFIFSLPSLAIDFDLGFCLRRRWLTRSYI